MYECELCGSDQFMPLGSFLSIGYMRCRCCGMDYTTKHGDMVELDEPEN